MNFDNGIQHSNWTFSEPVENLSSNSITALNATGKENSWEALSQCTNTFTKYSIRLAEVLISYRFFLFYMTTLRNKKLGKLTPYKVPYDSTCNMTIS